MKKSDPSKIPNGQTRVAFRKSQNPKQASSYKNFRELRDEIGVTKPRPKKSRPRAKLNRTKQPRFQPGSPPQRGWDF